MFIVIKKWKLCLILFLLTFFSFSLCIFYSYSQKAVLNSDNNNGMVSSKVNDIFEIRNKSILNNDEKSIKKIYNTKIKYSQYAYEHEVRKLKYLHNWSEKQGVKFIKIKPNVRIKSIKGGNDNYSVNLNCTTEYSYVYENDSYTDDDKSKVNTFRIGTSHILKLHNENNDWYITKEWYTDPFADSLNLENLKTSDIKKHILSQNQRDFSNLSKRRINAINYADKYCGTASEEKFGFNYNPKYGNYNPQGGDCANFASQILHEGGKFRKNGAWNIDKSGGTRSWLNAQGFKDYMTGSGRASVIARGTYNQVYKASYNLLPGDFVAYEKKGKITHISVITGADSKGYSLVNCHNTDRYRVPWDLGWSDKKIRFWLVRMHF